MIINGVVFLLIQFVVSKEDKCNTLTVECRVNAYLDNNNVSGVPGYKHNTTIQILLSENDTEWIRYLGCFNLQTLVEGNFTENKVEITNQTKLDDCISKCMKIQDTRRYFGFQTTRCYCYDNSYINNITSCEPSLCDLRSRDTCEQSSETVVALYYRGSSMYNESDTPCLESQRNRTGSKNSAKLHNITYVCTEQKDAENQHSCNKSMRYEVNSSTCNTSTSGFSSTVDNSTRNRKQWRDTFSCTILEYGNLSSTQIASSCVAAAIHSDSNNCYTAYVKCEMSGKIDIDYLPNHEEVSNKQDCSMSNCVSYIIGTVAGCLTVIVLLMIICICRKKQRKPADRASEPARFNVIPTSAEDCYITSLEDDYSVAHFGIANNIKDADSTSISQHGNVNKQNTGDFDITQTTTLCQDSLAEYSIATPTQYSIATPTLYSTAESNVYSLAQTNTCVSDNLNNENTECEYNKLEHTLKKTGVDTESTVYDKVRPSIVPSAKFAGSEYDSVDSINKCKLNSKNGIK